MNSNSRITVSVRTTILLAALLIFVSHPALSFAGSECNSSCGTPSRVA